METLVDAIYDKYRENANQSIIYSYNFKDDNSDKLNGLSDFKATVALSSPLVDESNNNDQLAVNSNPEGKINLSKLSQ